MNSIVTGIDIGGTHITVCPVDTQKGIPLTQGMVRMHIATDVSREEIIESWCAPIRKSHAATGLPIGKIGIAMPGPFDYKEGISYIKGLSKYEDLYGCNVKSMMAESLGIPAGNIRFINDATAFLMGEMHAGAAKGFHNVVGITLGTGLGSAAFYNEQLEEGDLYCTNYLQLKCEDYLSARWLINQYNTLSKQSVESVKALAGLAAKDELAASIFKQFGIHLAQVLHSRYALQRPEIIVIGGNISKAWSLFVPETLQRMVQMGVNYHLRPAQLGEDAALIGAAFLHQDQLF